MNPKTLIWMMGVMCPNGYVTILQVVNSAFIRQRTPSHYLNTCGCKQFNASRNWAFVTTYWLLDPGKCTIIHRIALIGLVLICSMVTLFLTSPLPGLQYVWINSRVVLGLTLFLVKFTHAPLHDKLVRKYMLSLSIESSRSPILNTPCFSSHHWMIQLRRSS